MNTTEKLSQCTKQELISLRERNLQMLSQQSVIATLPDGGCKLKQANELIERILYEQDMSIIQELQDMSVLTPHQGARKKSVDLANQQAYNHYSSTRLLSKPNTKKMPAKYPSIFQSQKATLSENTKVRMLTLEESMSLQKEQESSVKNCDKYFDLNQPSKSLLKSLNLSIDVIQDVNMNEIEFPINEDEETDEDIMMVD